MTYRGSKEYAVYFQFKVHTHEKASQDHFAITRYPPYSFKYHDLANIIQRTCMTHDSIPTTVRHYTVTSRSCVTMPTSLQMGTKHPVLG